ncbi:MAG TPA: ferritin-like domain-containing protein [Verrucomicrobiales bacterium]|nr:ferritin-like domain-containing protein [Verrucomicrobiales bacterium]
MQIETLRDLLIHELKDLYSAEKQLVKALPKVAKAATNTDLKAGVEQHLEETKEHVNRLEQIFERLGTSSRGPKCKGMEGLIEESATLIEDEPEEEVLDAGLICGSQKIEHYEIAGYGCARAFAELLGEEEVMELLQQTLDEEKATDEKLTALALTAVNVAAADDAESDEDREASPRGGNGGRSKSSTAGKSGGSRKQPAIAGGGH